MERLPDPIAQRASRMPDRTALSEVKSGRTLSYAELNGRIDAGAAWLRQAGVGAGDRVGILCRNRIAFFECLFACARIGAILAPYNWRLPPSGVAALIAQSSPKLILAGDAQLTSLDGTSVPVHNLSVWDALEPIESENSSTWSADDPWYLLYTSGTTGEPKAVINTARMAQTTAAAIGDHLRLTEADRTLNFLPLFHSAGLNLYTLSVLFRGGHVVILETADASGILDALDNFDITVQFAVPSNYQALLQVPGFESVDLTRTRHWGCGGAVLPRQTFEAFAACGVTICCGYGLTETGPFAFLATETESRAAAGTVGKMRGAASFRLCDDGEIQFKGDSITPGYWQNEAATTDAFTDDGWFKSGDIGRQDEDGLVYVLGRRDDMFISGGENVFPGEVEAVFRQHPAIKEIAVIGVPDQRWGQIGVAFVETGEMTPPPPAELSAFGATHLPSYKIPQFFQYIDKFPRTATGKIEKHLLHFETPIS